MSWFQLDAKSISERVQASGQPAKIPTLGASLARGMIGFTLLSVAGFAPWAVTGRWFYRNVGEAGLYLFCAVVFIGLSGPLLHRLIIGPGSLPRFYKLFGLAFAAYSVLWIGGWMALRGHAGSIVGLLAGTAAMGWILARAFGAKGAWRVVAAIFFLNSAGYFIGGWVEAAVAGMESPVILGQVLAKRTQTMIAQLLWGVFYGIGFGAGLGLAFYYCQEGARALLARAPEAEH